MSQTPTASKNQNGALLGLTITCFILSILPFNAFMPHLAIGILVFDVICMILAIIILVQSSKSPDAKKGKIIASLVMSGVAALIATAYIVIVPILDTAARNAACTLQTTVDLNECPDGYELGPNQILRRTAGDEGFDSPSVSPKLRD